MMILTEVDQTGKLIGNAQIPDRCSSNNASMVALFYRTVSYWSVLSHSSPMCCLLMFFRKRHKKYLTAWRTLHLTDSVKIRHLQLTYSLTSIHWKFHKICSKAIKDILKNILRFLHTVYSSRCLHRNLDYSELHECVIVEIVQVDLIFQYRVWGVCGLVVIVPDGTRCPLCVVLDARYDPATPTVCTYGYCDRDGRRSIGLTRTVLLFTLNVVDGSPKFDPLSNCISVSACPQCRVLPYSGSS